jgi:hypothetical protein
MFAKIMHRTVGNPFRRSGIRSELPGSGRRIVTRLPERLDSACQPRRKFRQDTLTTGERLPSTYFVLANTFNIAAGYY